MAHQNGISGELSRLQKINVKKTNESGVIG